MNNSTEIHVVEETKSTRKAVYDGVLAYISQNNLKPGDKLPSEHEWVDILQVSRTSLREGIRMLEGAGFVNTRHGGGMYVAKYDSSVLMDYIQYSVGFEHDNVAELYEMRKCLEMHFISEAAKKITDDQIVRLKKIVAQMNESEPIEYHWLDMDFHLILYENISNQLAVHLIRLYWDVMLCRWMPTRQDRLPEIVVGCHEQIVRALESHNPQFVKAAMQVHMYDSHVVEKV